MKIGRLSCFTLASRISVVAATLFAIVFSTLVSAQGTRANQVSSITVGNVGAQASPLFLPSRKCSWPHAGTSPTLRKRAERTLP